MINETALICGGFLSPLWKSCKNACNPVFLIKLEQDRGRGGEGKERKGREGGWWVGVFASAMFVNAIQQC